MVDRVAYQLMNNNGHLFGKVASKICKLKKVKRYCANSQQQSSCDNKQVEEVYTKLFHYQII